jgi:hypothetical protein
MPNIRRSVVAEAGELKVDPSLPLARTHIGRLCIDNQPGGTSENIAVPDAAVDMYKCCVEVLNR